MGKSNKLWKGQKAAKPHPGKHMTRIIAATEEYNLRDCLFSVQVTLP